ncbi:hypothetical protein TeGR_g9086, partial [Tetraparma gracilis]
MSITQEKDLLLKIRDPGVSDEEAVSIASAFFNKHAPSGSATRTFFHHMFMRICKNRLRPSHVCNKPLADLTTSDGVTIGASLSSCLFSNTEGNTGVEEWVSNFPALQELDKEYSWFRPLVNSLAEKLLIDSPWGANLRMLVAGGASMLDKASGISVVLRVGASSETGAVILGIMGFAFVLQSMPLAIQYAKSSWGRLMWELFLTLTGLKPGVDAYRVAKGLTQDKGQAFSAKVELITVRTCLLFAESIPRSVYQVYVCLVALERGDELELSILSSIIIGAMTAGMTSAMIS